jgi:hypothetical protein
VFVVSKSEKLRAAVDAERQRCLALVVEYRESIERKFSKHPNPGSLYADSVNKVLKSLAYIEAEIKHPSAVAEPAMVLPGDFSMDEMERAMAMIEEQERNPFEV